MTASPDPMGRGLRAAQFLAGDPVRHARIGQAPHQVLLRQGPTALRFFPAAAGATALPPVFVSMPLINTWTIFDLLPGRSIIEALTAAGVSVYLLDWGAPGPEDRHRSLAELVDGYIVRALQRSTRDSQARGLPGDGGIDAIGYCVGGTFLAVAAARSPALVRRLCLLAAPIDFHQSGRLHRWADPATFPLDDLVDGLGNFPASLLQQSFAWLRPSGQSAKYRSLVERIDDDGFRGLWAALERWNSTAVDFPGEAYREYVRRCYFDNALVAGGWLLDGRAVDLSAATAPALVISAQDDHICPPAAANGLQAVWGGEVETRTIPGGHVGVCVGKHLPAALLEWVRR